MGLLILLLLSAPTPTPTLAQSLELSTVGGDAAGDVPAQRAALLALLRSAGKGSLLRGGNLNVSDSEYVDGELPWDTPGTSYCDWWGVSCCGTSLSRVTLLCSQGERSVSAVEVSNLRLNGTLPLELGDLVDLHMLDVSFNMGEWYLIR